MSAIEGSTVNLRTMADGTLRISIDVEPTSAQAAFALFGAPGTPVALAALRVGHAMALDEPAAIEPKGGPLSQWLAQRCKEPVFLEWLDSEFSGFSARTPEQVSKFVCEYIGVTRKREIDSDEYAPTRLKGRIMQPYSRWLEEWNFLKVKEGRT